MNSREIKTQALAQLIDFCEELVNRQDVDDLRSILLDDHESGYLWKIHGDRTRGDAFTIVSILEIIQRQFERTGFDACGFDKASDKAVETAKNLIK